MCVHCVWWHRCGYAATFEQPWLQGVRVGKVVRATVAECAELLRTREIDGVLMDTPIMAYYRTQAAWTLDTPLTISPPLEAPLVVRAAACS